jgi:hypothetical protein
MIAETYIFFQNIFSPFSIKGIFQYGCACSFCIIVEDILTEPDTNTHYYLINNVHEGKKGNRAK